jgi:hypothetical protein
MSNYDKLNNLFEMLLEADPRYSLDPRVLATKLAGRNTGVSASDVETRNIFAGTFVSQAAHALESAIASGMVDPKLKGTAEKAGQQSISSYLTNWYNTYMRASGVSSQNSPGFDNIAKEVEQAYQGESAGSWLRKPGAGKQTKAYLGKMANLGWAAYHSRGPGQGAGMKPSLVTDPGTSPSAPSGGPGGGSSPDDKVIDYQTLVRQVKDTVNLVNKFDQVTKTKAVNAILNQTGTAAMTDPMLSAIEVDRISKDDMKKLYAALGRKLGVEPEETPQQDLGLAVNMPKDVPNNVTFLNPNKHKPK